VLGINRRIESLQRIIMLAECREMLRRAKRLRCSMNLSPKINPGGE